MPTRQYEFDALVDFAYNPGGRLRVVAKHLNAGEVALAMSEIKKVVKSGSTVMPGLVRRRDDEVTLFKTGKYQ